MTSGGTKRPPAQGEATISTCGPDNPNTNIAVYEGCDACPTVSNPGGYLACNQDSLQAGCFMPAHVTFYVTVGQCFKIRVADQEGLAVSGDLTITCRKYCPPGLVAFLEPPYGVVDARRPHAPKDSTELEGIDFVRVATFPTDPSCWSLCETNLNASLHPLYPPELAQNGIIAATEQQPGEYRFQLKRPITPGETTIIRYIDDLGQVIFSATWTGMSARIPQTF